MNPENINVGDELQVKRGFLSKGSSPVPVTITEKLKAQAEGGYIFKTSPAVGSGHGLCSYWFEPLNI